MEHTSLLEVLCRCHSMPAEIGVCKGKLSSKCLKCGFCSIEHLSEQQIAYILEDAISDLYLNACPGSGKTEVVGVKAAYEINRWNNRHTGIAILTFTNSAENELRSRVSSYLGHQVEYPHFLGTFSSWLHGYIANPFLELISGHHDESDSDNSIRVIDTDCTSNFLHAFQTKYQYKELGCIKANEFYITEKSEVSVIYVGPYRDRQTILDECLRTDAWRLSELIGLKERFWKSGFATYEDIEYLTYKLLQKHSDITTCLAQRFPLIIVDECQDLAFSQLQILHELHNHGTKLHFIGDLDQSIYKFRNINPSETKSFIEQLGMKELRLSENYRSCQPIVDASLAVLKKPQNSVIGKLEKKLDAPLIALLYQQDQEGQVIKEFETLINANQLSFENSRVIVRNNTLREKLFGRKFSSSQTINTIEEYARSLYLCCTDNSVNGFQSSIKILARAIQRTYFSASVHSSFDQLSKPDELDSQEWRTTISGVRKQLLSKEILLDFCCTWSQWKANLKPVLDNLAAETTGISILHGQAVDLGKIRSGAAKAILLETFESTPNISIPFDIETIHSCKGMSLDAVLFMSAYRRSRDQDSGSHWCDWFAIDNNSISEGNRLAYISFSRARHLIVLGIPNPLSSPLSETELQLLVQAGFKINSLSE
ncbi:ATP-dependent helicase [Acutalibacter caecimuris]|uniref:ATP-dependent helicase n=1 Tax=Acutalibacter caecimuris TaxID=3093657 RepID=UPI002AC8E04E|nr:ATP-dependent helicase [Acutalibacter sp. M00118]